MAERNTRYGARYKPYPTLPPSPKPPPLSTSYFIQDALDREGEDDSDHEVEYGEHDAVQTIAPHVDSGKMQPTVTSKTPEASSCANEPNNLTRTQRNNLKYRAKRVMKRTTDSDSKAYILRKRTSSAANSIPVPVDYQEHVEPVSTAWTGKAPPKESGKEYSLAELQDLFGMRLVEFQGCETQPIIDANGVVIGVLGARPRGDDWARVCESAVHEFHTAQATVNFPPVGTDKGRRGRFSTLYVGISHGNGRGKPGNFAHTKHNAEVLGRLLRHDSVQRLAGHGNQLLQAFSPRLHGYYSSTLDALVERSHGKLRRNSERNVFAAVAFNFGPRVVSIPHRDFANLAWGWCSITALGNYDPDKGGHLVLWDLGLVIRFPPGTTILIPSAMIRHSNTPVQDGEVRLSLVQYSAGSLFRWVENEFMTQDDWRKQASKEELNRRDRDNELRWRKGLEMLSRLDELRR